ncbi:MAG: hypothetical protein R8K46_09820 [Mariprofundaceae bacterium]
MIAWRGVIFLSVLLFAAVTQAAPPSAYDAAMQLAAQGLDVQAVQRLRGGSGSPALDGPWRDRLIAAAALIEARSVHAVTVHLADAPMQQALAEVYIRDRALPQAVGTWQAGLLSLLLPGGGHAWQGRWRDAGVAAMMVWPMIGLTLWAARRRMGPVTVFFAMITIWLWSGVVFSALSMAEREAAEAYMQWWQGLWWATGLPGRPW